MKLSLSLTISLIIVTLIIGIGIGYAISHTYQESMFENNIMDLGPADRWLDLRYLDAMATHHRGAMLLASQAQEQSRRTEIHNLATEILANEPKLIEELYTWKRAWYKDNRRAKDPIVANLTTYDDTFDLRFLNALIAHHEAGITMTSEVRTKSSNKEILNNADTVENFLEDSLVTLNNWRSIWYNTK